jgi:hypothetical protein
MERGENGLSECHAQAGRESAWQARHGLASMSAGKSLQFEESVAMGCYDEYAYFLKMCVA